MHAEQKQSMNTNTYDTQQVQTDMILCDFPFQEVEHSMQYIHYVNIQKVDKVFLYSIYLERDKHIEYDMLSMLEQQPCGQTESDDDHETTPFFVLQKVVVNYLFYDQKPFNKSVICYPGHFILSQHLELFKLIAKNLFMLIPLHVYDLVIYYNDAPEVKHSYSVIHDEQLHIRNFVSRKISINQYVDKKLYKEAVSIMNNM
jgi:hypothetical protein